MDYDLKRLYVSINFANRSSNDIIGEVDKLTIKDSKIFADITLYDKFVDGFPAIAGTILKKRDKTIHSFRLTSVSICSGPNTDPEIKRLSDQLKT